MINGEDWIEASHDRLLGYRQALTTHDVAVDPTLIVSGGWTLASGREQAHRLLDLPNPPTAMFCYCDRMALGAYEAVLSRVKRFLTIFRLWVTATNPLLPTCTLR